MTEYAPLLLFNLDRELFEDIFHEFLLKTGFLNDKGYTDIYYDSFENSTFIIRPFCWDDCDCGYAEKDEFVNGEYHIVDCCCAKPNFVFKPTNFMMEWYKYPLRSPSANRNVSQDEFKEILLKCLESLI